MSLSIYNKTIKSLMQDSKEIVKIERVEDGKILYEKKENDFLFYDDASADKSSEYSGYLCEGGTYSSISYNNNQYTITGGSKTTARFIDSIGQLENCEITLKAKPTANAFSGLIGVAFGTGTGNVVGIMPYRDSKSTRKVRYANSSWQESYSSYFNNTVVLDDNGWVTIHIIKQGTTITGNCGGDDFTFTLPFNQCYIGIINGNATQYFKEFEIKTFHSYDLSVTASEDAVSNGVTMSLTATLTDNNVPVTGKRLSYQIKHDNMVISSGSDTTDNNGQIPIYYTGTGIGDVDIIISYGNLAQKTYKIEDCYYYNDGSRVSDLEIGNGVSCTTNGNYITITTSTSGEKYVYLPKTLSDADNFMFEAEIADTGTLQPVALNYDNSDKWAGHSINGSQWFANSGTNDTYTQAYQVGDKLTIIRENGVDKAILNDNIIISNRTASHNSTFKVGFYTNNGRVQKIKNIKLKVLHSYDLSISASDDIISSGDTTTLTATLTDYSTPVTGETLSYQIKHDNAIISSGSDTTDNNGQISFNYTGEGVGDVEIIVSYGDSLQETYEIEDLIFYSSDGTNLSGTYETGSDGIYNYITNLKADVQLSNLNLPSHFVFSMKYYPNNSGTQGNNLWLIGSDINNGVLIGAEATNTCLRIYNWVNSSGSSQQIRNSSFSIYDWNELEIEYDNGVWTSRVGTNSITWNKTFNPTLIKNYSDIPASRLCDFKIKALP